MPQIRGFHPSLLVCLAACSASGIVDDPAGDCSFDGDLSPGVQGSLSSYQTTLPATLGPGASANVAVQLFGIDDPAHSVGAVCNKEVRWILGPGSGTVQTTPTLTSSGGAFGTDKGVARTTWVMPTVQGIPVTLTAEVVNSVPLLQVVFTTSTTPPPDGIPTQVSRNPGTFPEPQSGTAGSAVALPPSVKVTDHAGNPPTPVLVTFTVTAGGGSLSASSLVASLEVATGADGIATAPVWILGTVGTNTVQATVGPLQPVTFTANAAPAPALLTLAIHQGNNQSALINNTVAIAPSVIVRNAQGAGVAGVTITWQVVQGSGIFLPDAAVAPNANATNGEGIARLLYFGPTLGGTIKLRATVTSQHQVTPLSVEFTFTGLAP